MKHLIIFGLFYVGLVIQAHGQTTGNQPAASRDDWSSFDGNEYYIRYPKDWDIDKTGRMGTAFFIFSKQKSPEDQFKENVNLVIQDLGGQQIDLDKYTEISKNQINTMIKNGEILESKTLVKGGLNFQKIIFAGDQDAFSLIFEQFYFIKNGKAYVLTLTCEANQFDVYKETGEKILNSFALK